MLHGMNQNQHGIKDPWGGISYILQYTAVWAKTRGTLVVKDGQTVEKSVTGWVPASSWTGGNRDEDKPRPRRCH